MNLAERPYSRKTADPSTLIPPTLERQLHAHVHGPLANANAGIMRSISPPFHGRIVTLGRLGISDDLRRWLRLWLCYRLKVRTRREGLHPQTPPAASAHSQERRWQESCDHQAL